MTYRGLLVGLIQTFKSQIERNATNPQIMCAMEQLLGEDFRMLRYFENVWLKQSEEWLREALGGLNGWIFGEWCHRDAELVLITGKSHIDWLKLVEPGWVALPTHCYTREAA